MWSNKIYKVQQKSAVIQKFSLDSAVASLADKRIKYYDISLQLILGAGIKAILSCFKYAKGYLLVKLPSDYFHLQNNVLSCCKLQTTSNSKNLNLKSTLE